MKRAIEQLLYFLKEGIWLIQRENTSVLVFVFVDLLRKLILSVKYFFGKRVTAVASALTYSTLLSVVPIVAVLFGIARGFGFNSYIEQSFRNALSSQPQAADIIVEFVNSYLVHAQSGVILGVGLLFMLFTVLNLTSNIEQAFNDIWQVKAERSLLRTVTDYLAMFFMLPIVIVMMSGITIFMTAVADRTSSYMLVGSTMRFLIDLLPYVFMSLVFITLYRFMPNTKVKFSSVIVPGILAGCCMQLLQFVYINSQIFLSSYNAIYGSFAALPLFILWVQVSWTICLFGAELSYCNQNMEELAFLVDTKAISQRYRMLMSAILMGHICRRFSEGKKPYTAVELKLLTGIPIRVTTDLLYQLAKVHLIIENISGLESNREPTYLPAEPLRNMTVGNMLDRLEADGTWKLSLHLDRLESNLAWQEVLKARKEYLNSLRNINLVDV